MGYNLLENISFQVLFDASSEALILSDEAGRILVSNPASHNLFGYTLEEMHGMAVEMLMPERFRGHHHHFREAYVKNSEKRPMGKGRELVALSRDGRELQVDIGLSPITLGEQKCILMTFFDATQSRQAQRNLQESEERLRLAKNAAGLGVFDRDLTSNTLHWDAQAKKILGLLPEDEGTYEQFQSIVYPEDAATRRAALQHALDPSHHGEYEAKFRIVDPGNGSLRWISSSGRVIFDNGRPVRLIGVMQDITQQIQVEQKLHEQRQETEALIRRQIAGQTASAIAHELNQPLAAVSAYSEVAMRELDSIECPDRLRRALNGCVEQAQRAGKALHELLEFLRSGDVEVEEFDLNATIREMMAGAQNSGLRAFKPVLQLMPDLPPVLANEVQVQKVLANLIRNGLEAMEDAGEAEPVITVSVRAIGEEGLAEVTVQDNGPGLESETVHRIFDPFFTTKTRGIGMGLAVSHSLIKANGGDLWAVPGGTSGAIFHFTLPLAV